MTGIDAAAARRSLAPGARRWGLVFLVVLPALAVLLVLAVGFGSTSIPPLRVAAALAGGGDPTDSLIVLQFRLPRALLALEAGACLALAGMLLQSAARNPLASPAVLGVVDGAAVGVLAFLFLFSDEANRLTVSIHWQPVAAALGAAVFAMLVALLAGRDVTNPLRLILYGVALAALARAIATLLMIVGPIFRASQLLIWLAGSVHEADWLDVRIVGLGLLVLSLAAAALPRFLDQHELDDDSAAATGLPLFAVKGASLALAVLLTALAVAFVGGIAFVGLIAPHAARLIVGVDSAARMVLAALLGGGIVLAADVLGRVAFSPLELPTGAVTALVGAPYFLYLLVFRSRSHG